jgi:hypothetical protein
MPGTDLDRPAENGGMAQALAPAGRYQKVKERTFGEVCQDAEKGPKFHLDDEIALIRSYLAQIVDEMEKGKTRLSAKQFNDTLRNLRETLKQAAEHEGLVSVKQVRAWAASFMAIIREEVKDEDVVNRIQRRAARAAI